MNEIGKTVAVAGSALVLAVVASMMGPRAVALASTDDEGQDVFPAFTDADAVTELQVSEFREASGEVYPFSVKRDEKGRWTIPSHGDQAKTVNRPSCDATSASASR